MSEEKHREMVRRIKENIRKEAEESVNNLSKEELINYIEVLENEIFELDNDKVFIYSKEDIDKKYEEGYDNGFYKGKNQGYNEGDEEGFVIGKTEGFKKGKEEGEHMGFHDGYEEGYEDSKNGIEKQI